MKIKKSEIVIDHPSKYYDIVEFHIGTQIFEEWIPIICPCQTNDSIPHQIVKNGHDTNHTSNIQQYHCKNCKRTFYPHTSREILSINANLRSYLNTNLQGAKLNSGAIIKCMNCSKSTATRILYQIIKYIPQSKNFKDLRKKHRNSSVLIIDETFLKICSKTWYLILIISGNKKIMDFKLVEHRSVKIIKEMIEKCKNRLNYSLKTIITDGFRGYQGAINELRLPIIHVRHIHKPPYGRIIINRYQYSKSHVTIHSIKTVNDISKFEGYFLGDCQVVKKSLGTQKRGRKPGGKNRPKDVILAEKEKRKKENRNRGRPKGSKKKKKPPNTHIFYYHKKVGCVRAVDDSPKEIAEGLTQVFKQFPNLHITTNLVENQYSILKKLINFRGRRTISQWNDLLTGYFAIRDNPKLLFDAINRLNFSSKTRRITYSHGKIQIGVIST